MSETLCQRVWLTLAGLSGACAVGAEAYARHGLDPVAQKWAVDMVQLAARYQGLHALALIALLGMLARARSGFARATVTVAGWAFVVGLILFCGGLYLRAIGVLTSPSAIVPVGGTSFTLGWLALAAAGAIWHRADDRA